MLVRLCSKSIKLGFSSMWTKNFQMYKLGLEKAEEPEIKQPTFIGSYRKQGNYRKTSTSALLAMLEPLKLWITANCGKFWKRWEYQTTLPASYVQVKKLQLEPHVEKLAGSKLEKEYIKAVYCHSVYLMYMQITSFKMLHSVCQQIWKTQQQPQDWKRSIFIPIPKKGSTKECSNHWTIGVISHASKVTLKSFNLGFSIMWTENFQMFKLGLEKTEEPEIKLPTFHRS